DKGNQWFALQQEQPEGSLGEAALGAPPGTGFPLDSAPAGAGLLRAPAGAKREGERTGTWGAKPPQATLWLPLRGALCG
ncbi:MAG TPA: hypothetical protein PLB18_02350, partial [Acidobacteriota bacterium]|nr:hypothetical protein [Acidobacteriota bacterium]